MKKQHSTIISLINLILLFSVLSFILSLFKLDAIKPNITNGVLESSIVVVKNVLSKDGILNIITNINNSNLWNIFFSILVSLVSFSVLKYSGLLKHLFLPLKKISSFYVTLLIIFLGIISTFVGDYCYVILLPFSAILYKYLNKNPILGIISSFLGITLGYGTGIFYNFNDYALGTFTQMSANVAVDASYQFNLASNLYIMIFSLVALSLLLTILVESYLTKKIPVKEKYEDDLRISKKGMIITTIVFTLITLCFIFMIVPNGVLLDNTQNVYIAKLLSPTAPFNQSFMIMFLMASLFLGFIYGFVSRNFKNSNDYSLAISKELNNIGFLFILLLLTNILINIIEWSNMGLVISGSLISLLSKFNFTGIVLILISFIIIVFIGIFIPNSLEKWALISPILVPLFMRGNLSPDYSQFLFKTADSIGKIISPIFIYWPIMIGFVQKYNSKDEEITLRQIVKKIMPIILTIIVFWIIILILWYVAGLPLGIKTLVTM